MLAFLRLWLLIALLLFGGSASASKSAGCGKAPTLASGTKSTTVNGQNRQYTIRVPANYNPANPYKLIFALHWSGINMSEIATGQIVQRDYYNYYGLQRLANETAIFVSPQGIDNNWARDDNNGGDIAFIDTIVSQVNAGLCVDQSKIFSTGFSCGARFSYALACARPNVFRAISAISPETVCDCSASTQPVAYLGIYGIRDSADVQNAAQKAIRHQTVMNGCLQTYPSGIPGDPSLEGSLTHVKILGSCYRALPVTYIAFDAGHIPAPYDGGTGNNALKSFAPSETWAFFSQFD